jgi:hypothetical protein
MSRKSFGRSPVVLSLLNPRLATTSNNVCLLGSDGDSRADPAERQQDRSDRKAANRAKPKSGTMKGKSGARRVPTGRHRKREE